MSERIVLCIPGPWSDDKALRAAFAEHAPDFAIGRGSLMETATEILYRIELIEHDPRLREAFENAGGGRLPRALLDLVGSHKSILILTQDSTGPDSAAAIIQAGEAVLDAGGFAVKVESSGVAFAPTVWQQFAESDEPTDIYAAFVAHAYDEASAYSCGMHNLGLPDSAVQGLGGTEAVKLLEVFNLYQYLESPRLQPGQTFALEPDAPRFTMNLVECTAFPSDHLYHNPHGIWQLVASPKAG